MTIMQTTTARRISLTAKLFFITLIGLLATIFIGASPAEAAVTYKASATRCNDNSNTSVSVPGGTVNGDVLLMVINSKSTASQSTPSGWTRIGTQQNNGSSLATSIFYRIANNEPGSYTPSTSGVSHCLSISSFSGVDATSPINAASQRANTQSTIITANAITPSVADTHVVFVSGYADDRTHSNYSGTNPFFSERLDVNTSNGSDNALALASGAKTDTTSTGNRTASASNPSAVNNGFLIALAPSAPLPPQVMTVSGTCKQADNATDCTDTGTIRIAVNGVLQAQTQSIVGGTWSISGVSASVNAAITVFIDEALSESRAVAVTTYDGTGDIAGLELIENALSIGNSDNRTVSNAHIAQYDNSVSGDADIFAEVDSNNDLNVDPSATMASELLFVKSGNTYRPDSASSGFITTHDVLNAGTIQADGNTITLDGSWKNTGLFMSGTSNVAFNATSTETISGGLNATSSFYRVSFTGGGDWTIKDAMKVSAATATDAFVVRNGTVTIGDSAGDNLEVIGKVVIAGTAGETGTLRSPALTQGNTLTIDLNNNIAPLSCANCVISVGATTGVGSGSLKLGKNTHLRLNPRSASVASDSGVEVQSTGYLEILGSQEGSSTVSLLTQNASSTVLGVTGATWTAGQFDGMTLRFTSPTRGSFGKLYAITNSTVDSMSIQANTTATDSNPQVAQGTACAGNGNCVVELADNLMTISGQFVGSYLHNITDDKYYLIASSTELATDVVRIISNSPDDFTSMDDGDDVEITDGIRAGDTFEIIDYAHVTAESGLACTSPVNQGGEAYIFGKSGSETLIRYADICNLGRDATGKAGISFDGVSGLNAQEGFTVDTSRIQKNLRGIALSNSERNSGAKGARNNSINNSAHAGIYLAGSTDNALSFNNFSANESAFVLNGNNGGNVMESNSISRSTAHGVLLINSSGNSIKGNRIFNNGSVYEDHQGLFLVGGSNNNIIDGNQSFTNITWGIVAGNGSSNNTISNNLTHNNRKSGLVFEQFNNTIFKNKSFNNGFHGLTTVCGSIDNPTTVLFDNDFYLNDKAGLILESAADCLTTVINDEYGVHGANAIVDVSFGPAGSPVSGDHKAVLYNTTLASGLEGDYTDMVGLDFYTISRKHDGVSGKTQIWGHYTVPADIAETPQDESRAKFNYADSLWEKSATPHGYAGVGSEDSNLNYNLSTANLSAGPYQYRATVKSAGVCGIAVFDIFRNNEDIGDATCGSQFTDPTTSVAFKIDGGGSAYALRDSYTFVVWDGSGDATNQKTVTMMQDKDTFIVATSSALELKGQSPSLNPTQITRGSTGGYQFGVSGALDANGYKFDYLGGTGQGAGLILNTGATIASLSNGSFDNYAVNGSTDAFIRVASSLIGSGSPALVISGLSFENTGANAECNFNATASTTGYYEMQTFSGSFAGENFDCQNGVADPTPGSFVWTP